MTKSVIQQVYDLLADEEVLLEFARTKGEPIEKGDLEVSLKAAALVGALGNAWQLAFKRNGEVKDDTFLAHLKNLAEGVEYPFDDLGICFTAHLTWLTSQFYRGPEKIARIAQFNFTTLTPETIDVDRIHVAHAAKFLLGKLQSQAQSQAA